MEIEFLRQAALKPFLVSDPFSMQLVRKLHEEGKLIVEFRYDSNADADHPLSLRVLGCTQIGKSSLAAAQNDAFALWSL